MENIQYKKLEYILTDKDYRTSNGTLVLVCDAELWERTGIIEPTLISMTPINFQPDDSLYSARGEWVTTTEPFCIVTPKEESEKIKLRQKEIYWEIVNEFLEWYKIEFLAGLKNAPDEKGFLESELEDWRNYTFPREVVKGQRYFTKIVPRCVQEVYPIIKGMNTNDQPKEEARYRFFKWLKEYQLSNEIPPPLNNSTDANQEDNKGDRKKDPYNAKVKAKFFELTIDRFDNRILKESYKNNDDKFEAYAKAMNEHFALSLAAGTLENNWGKGLNKREKDQVVKLLKEYKQNDLAVKFSLEP
ncbi:hypothetical protein [Runella sp.]|uniref:hypothetical protein n=1 Tax=Runella sp. TaxID=1960881 RepID=UPI003D12A12A